MVETDSVNTLGSLLQNGFATHEGQKPGSIPLSTATAEGAVPLFQWRNRGSHKGVPSSTPDKWYQLHATGFEPALPFSGTDYESVAFDHSAMHAKAILSAINMRCNTSLVVRTGFPNG